MHGSVRPCKWSLVTEGPKPEKGFTDIIWEHVSSHLGTSSETVQKIRFGQGAVGKVAVIAVFAVLALGGIGIRVGGGTGSLGGRRDSSCHSARLGFGVLYRLEAPCIGSNGGCRTAPTSKFIAIRSSKRPNAYPFEKRRGATAWLNCSSSRSGWG